MNLGKAIQALRKKKSIKQMDLASAIDLSQTSLSLIESGAKQPSQATLDKICSFFGLPKPFIYFLALEESDIPKEKIDIYKALEPGLKTHIETLFVD